MPLPERRISAQKCSNWSELLTRLPYTGRVAPIVRTLTSANGGTEAARRDLLVVLILVSAVVLLIWNGGSLLQIATEGRSASFGTSMKVATTALILNVALILFGWRRYVDLQHEAELRADGERRAAIMASTDILTGLANRKGFADGLQQLNVEASDADRHIAILSVQMQRFKAVNDRHGYDVGDELLRRIASCVRQELPADAIIARLSGDEFAVAVACDGERPENVEQIGEALLRVLGRSHDIDGTLAQVGAFVGVAVQPAAHDNRPADLLRRADIALERARSARSARPVWFDTSMEQALIARSELEHAIRIGLEHDQFLPFFEPQVDLRTGAIIGFEVLARWQHPTRGLIRPDVFIPIAEDIGLIGLLSEKVIGAALAAARDWDPKLTVSVNISPTQLSDACLTQKIVRLLEDTEFPAERLIVEITESSLFADLELARSITTALKGHGISLALDDFGTGFSSLSQLRSLPLDMIKLDRSFVTTLLAERQSAAIIRAVTTLGSAIGVPVMVEGIEDAPTHAAVLALGARRGQGWYFGKAISAERTAELLRQNLAMPVTGPDAAPRLRAAS